jgi:hypothetical protein
MRQSGKENLLLLICDANMFLEVSNEYYKLKRSFGNKTDGSRLRKSTEISGSLQPVRKATSRLRQVLQEKFIT